MSSSRTNTIISPNTRVLFTDTRDRFFANYMTVAIGLFGFLGFLLHQESPVQSVERSNINLPTLSIFALIILIVFGLGTLFLLSGNWLARDYYRQRRRRIQELILSITSEDELRQGIQDYLGFSRDKTRWAYRLTSIYFIYSSSISVANALGVLLALSIAAPKVSVSISILLFAGIFFVQQLMCYLYIKLYTRRQYPEG